jgi:hypothetical protein
MPWAFETLLDNGISHDSSIFPTQRSHGGYQGFESKLPCILNLGVRELIELPMSTVQVAGRQLVYSGGGYFRFYPLMLTDYWLSKQDYVMTYLHPRDFDADQPIIPGLSMSRRFKSYYGLGSTESKLRTVLSNHQFVDVSQALASLDRNKLKRITIR